MLRALCSDTAYPSIGEHSSGAEGSCLAFHIGASTSPLCRQFFFYLNRQKKHETSDRAIYSALNQNKKEEGLCRPKPGQRSVKPSRANHANRILLKPAHG